MKRSRILIGLACGMVLYTVPHVSAQTMPEMTPEQKEEMHQKVMEMRRMHGLKTHSEVSTNDTSFDVLRQKMTLQNRMALGQANRIQPLAPNAASSTVPVNTLPVDHSADTSTPYGSIAVRNVFALNPVPPPAPPQDPNAIPPPKITLTGITTIFGPAEALYKVAAYNKNGKQVPEQPYILTEGEEQDEVGVTAIDTQKDIVTFDNHGETQVIPLANGVASGGSSGPNGGPGGPPGIVRRFGGNFPRPGGGPPGSFQPQLGGGNNNLNSAGQSYNNSVNNNASSQPNLSPDDQAALIAAQHAEAINNPNIHIPPMLFPPTKYDSEAMGGK